MSTLKLSDAIFMGRHTIEHPEAGEIGACAIPMALNSIGTCNGDDRDYDLLEKAWPWIMGLNIDCPWCQPYRQELLYQSLIVHHPFDAHVMTGQITLEQMCDWIRSIEPAEPSAYELAIQAAELYPLIPDTDTETSLHRGSTFDDITEMVERAEKGR